VTCNEPGLDRLHGGPGDDAFCDFDYATDDVSDIFHGGPGKDRINYRDAGRPLTVSLDGVRNDGAGCPQKCGPDNVDPTIENVLGAYDVPNTVVGSARSNVISVLTDLRPRNSTIIGMGGDDRLVTDEGNDSVSGGGGNDRLSSGAGDDSLNGGPGEDRCRGDSGVDNALDCELSFGIP
jgi:Ca2+-binding RTX toxin-like protein